MRSKTTTTRSVTKWITKTRSKTKTKWIKKWKSITRRISFGKKTMAKIIIIIRNIIILLKDVLMNENNVALQRKILKRIKRINNSIGKRKSERKILESKLCSMSIEVSTSSVTSQKHKRSDDKSFL